MPNGSRKAWNDLDPLQSGQSITGLSSGLHPGPARPVAQGIATFRLPSGQVTMGRTGVGDADAKGRPWHPWRARLAELAQPAQQASLHRAPERCMYSDATSRIRRRDFQSEKPGNAPEKVSRNANPLRDLPRKTEFKCKQLFKQPVRFLQSISVSQEIGLYLLVGQFIAKMHQSHLVIDFFIPILPNRSFDAKHPRPPR